MLRRCILTNSGVRRNAKALSRMTSTPLVPCHQQQLFHSAIDNFADMSPDAVAFVNKYSSNTSGLLHKDCVRSHDKLSFRDVQQCTALMADEFTNVLPKETLEVIQRFREGLPQPPSGRGKYSSQLHLSMQAYCSTTTVPTVAILSNDPLERMLLTNAVWTSLGIPTVLVSAENMCAANRNIGLCAVWVGHSVKKDKVDAVIAATSENSLHPICVAHLSHSVRWYVDSTQQDSSPPVSAATLSGLEPYYVSWSSGSTGMPKNALNQVHGAEMHRKAKVDLVGLDETSRVAVTAHPTFNVIYYQSLGAPSVGGCSYFYPLETMTQDPKKFLHWLREDEITHIQGTPTLFEHYLLPAMEHLTDVSEGYFRLRHLKSINFTGEALPPVLVDRCRSAFGSDVHISGSAGCNECSDDSVHAVYASPDDQSSTDVRTQPLSTTAVNEPALHVGAPIVGTTLRIVDDDKNENIIACTSSKTFLEDCRVSSGERGRLWILGEGVGLGYFSEGGLKAHGVTADGHPVFKINDWSSFDRDGHLRLHGRGGTEDGERVYIYNTEDGDVRRLNATELADVERTILQRASELSLPIEHAVVRSRTINGQEYLVCFFTCARRTQQDKIEAQQMICITQLRGFDAHLLSHWANRDDEHRIPSVFVPLPGNVLPLTTTGKLNERALPTVSIESILRVKAPQDIDTNDARHVVMRDAFSAVLPLQQHRTAPLPANESLLHQQQQQHPLSPKANECFYNLFGNAKLAKDLQGHLREKGYHLDLEAFNRGSAIRLNVNYLSKK